MFGILVFGAAFLLFVVEPMAAKQLLPVLGGASAVWVTCLVFFQTALLLGYLYAHWLVRRGPGWVWIHVAALAGGAVVLAVSWVGARSLGALGMDFEWSGAWVALHPVWTIFEVLSGTIGLPFLLLSATGPLLQVWWVRLSGGGVPYGLFGVSNAGSLLALVTYPVLIEPTMTLGAQRTAWAACFVAYAVGCGGLAMRVGRATGTAGQPSFSDASRSAGNSAKPAGVGRLRRGLWFLLPMGAAMQLTAVTSHLSQDVAAVPMLWVLPLGAYLLTFVVAFEAPWLYRRWIVGRVLAVLLASLGYALSRLDTTLPIGLAVLFFLVEVFVAGWFCHAEAYRLRPEEAEESTTFYLMVAAGGAAGTFLLAVVSPLVFRANYDLALSFLVTAALAAIVTWRDGWGQRALWVTGTGLLAALVVALHLGFARRTLMQSRDFYGALRVTQSDTDTSFAEQKGIAEALSAADVGTGQVRTLMNGRIRHGTQMLATDRRSTPTTYYAPDSGVGLAMLNCCKGRPRRVGVIGLGVGTLAAYSEAGDTFRFYEINPQVEPIARNLFTYLRDSPAGTAVIEGDGRAMLTRESPHHFDVLVVDAFSGDAIPLHLLTREAMSVYQRQLAPGGVIAFHVSNSFVDLAPEIERLAEASGMQARLFKSWAVPAEDEYSASWVLVSADGSFFAQPAVAEASQRISAPAGLRAWTDNYSSLLPVMRWGG